ILPAGRGGFSYAAALAALGVHVAAGVRHLRRLQMAHVAAHEHRFAGMAARGLPARLARARRPLLSRSIEQSRSAKPARMAVGSRQAVHWRIAAFRCCALPAIAVPPIWWAGSG